MAQLTKVRSGDPLRIPADDYNAAMDAARFVASRQHDVASGLRGGGRQACIVTVRNDSGEDRARFDVLGIDVPIILPAANATEFANRIALVGVTPTADHAGRFVVLTEPLAVGKIGRAVAAGVCQVRINVDDEDHAFADVDPGDATQLASGMSGAATILWMESGAGTSKLALIRFGGGSAGDGCIYAKLGAATEVGPSQRSYAWEQVEKTSAGYDGWTLKSGGRTSENDGEAYDLAEIPGDTNLPVPAGSIVKMCPVQIVGGGDVEYWFDRRYVYDCCSGCGCPDADDVPDEITATIAELLVAASDCIGGHSGYPGCPDSVPPCPPSDDYRVWSFGGWEVPSGEVTLTKTGPCTWSGSTTAHVNEYENEDCTGFLHQWDATFYVSVWCFNGRWTCGISVNVVNFPGFAGGFFDIAGYGEGLQGHVFHNQYDTDHWVIYGGTITISWSEP